MNINDLNDKSFSWGEVLSSLGDNMFYSDIIHTCESQTHMYECMVCNSLKPDTWMIFTSGIVLPGGVFRDHEALKVFKFQVKNVLFEVKAPYMDCNIPGYIFSSFAVFGQKKKKKEEEIG